MPQGFESLKIWQKAHQLALEIYKITSTFPKSEQFGITSQLRRAALSVAANIAEAHGRYHYKDMINFLFHSRGSIEEIRGFLAAARDITEIGLGNLEFQKIDTEYQGLSRGINTYIKSIKQKSIKQKTEKVV